MIKLIEARYQGEFQVSLRFSDGKKGVFDGGELLKRSGNSPIKREAASQRLRRICLVCGIS